jgi:hypothetical protein
MHPSHPAATLPGAAFSQCGHCAAVVQPPIVGAQARDPREAAGGPRLTAAVPADEQREIDLYKPNMMFCCGNVVHRHGDQEEEVISDACGAGHTHDVSVDAALFPALHPGGKGGYQRGDSLSRMLEQRSQQLFSPFTLLKEYGLVMFQVRPCANEVPDWALALPPLHPST